jgi:hypothetical protein
MKRLILILLALSVTGLSVGAHSGKRAEIAQNAALEGAWSYTDGDVEHTAVFVDGYFSHAIFNVKKQEFMGTRGGPYEWKDGKLSVIWQYDTEKVAQEVKAEDWIGKTGTFDLQVVAEGTMSNNLSGSAKTWRQLDKNGGVISGVWRMTGRKTDDNISTTPLRERRTLKILTGTRFQWVAINIANGQFSGTGGGRYTFENGKYTEHIEFFSRDNTRVGMALSFNGEMVDGSWHHSGLSSAGNPIYEIWGKLENKF